MGAKMLAMAYIRSTTISISIEITIGTSHIEDL